MRRTAAWAQVPHAERPLDLAYRAGELPYRLGWRGQVKHRLAGALEETAAASGLRADLSTAERAVLFGDDWFRFLASSRCVAGCESGASAMDPRGEVRALEARLRAAEPALTFEGFAARMPEGWDGHAFGAISPRHFEAALVGSCQVLVEGTYDGLLEPDVHYIPVRPDLANADEACGARSRRSTDRGAGGPRPHRTSWRAACTTTRRSRAASSRPSRRSCRHAPGASAAAPRCGP